MTGFAEAYGLVVLSSIIALCWSAALFKRDEADDNISAGIKTLFKVVFIGSALIISAVGMGGIRHLTTGEIDADAGLNNNAEISQFLNTTDALYNGMLNTYIIFIGFLLLFVIYMIIRNFKNNMRENGEE